MAHESRCRLAATCRAERHRQGRGMAASDRVDTTILDRPRAMGNSLTGNNRTGNNRTGNSRQAHTAGRESASNPPVAEDTASLPTDMAMACSATTTAGAPTGTGGPRGGGAVGGARREGEETTTATATPTTAVPATPTTVTTPTTTEGGASGGAGEGAGAAVARAAGGGVEETATKRVAAPRAVVPRTRTGVGVVVEGLGGLPVKSQAGHAANAARARARAGFESKGNRG